MNKQLENSQFKDSLCWKCRTNTVSERTIFGELYISRSMNLSCETLEDRALRCCNEFENYS